MITPVVVRDGRGDVPSDAAAFLRTLGRATAFRLAGQDRTRTRAVSAMLHGNEPSGFHAVHALLRSDVSPVVDLIVFIGAVEAAAIEPLWTHRMPPGRRDLNRCFGTMREDVDGAIAAAALDLFHGAHPEALVDLHNNTGHNPAYGVSPFADAGHLGLTSLFATRFVHTDLRLRSLMEAFPRTMPAVTIECGRAGVPSADRLATDGLFRYVTARTLPRVEREDPRMTVLMEPVRVTLRAGATVAFAESPVMDADVTLTSDVDRHNFQQLDAGEAIGWVRPGARLPIEARGADGEDVAARFFAVKGPLLVTARSLVPIMMTTNAEVARADCLFYVVRFA